MGPCSCYGFHALVWDSSLGEQETWALKEKAVCNRRNSRPNELTIRMQECTSIRECACRFFGHIIQYLPLTWKIATAVLWKGPLFLSDLRSIGLKYRLKKMASDIKEMSLSHWPLDHWVLDHTSSPLRWGQEKPAGVLNQCNMYAGPLHFVSFSEKARHPNHYPWIRVCILARFLIL